MLIESGKTGPNILLLGGIHGDEPSGTRAIERFECAIKNGSLKINFGSITTMPICNPNAKIKNIRYIDKNLNRCFYKGQEGTDYESGIAKEIMKDFIGKDFLLDLHSTSGKSNPFIFSERRNLDFAKKLGVEEIICGWGEIGSDVLAGDTESYMNSLGGQGFTFEAGNHLNPNGEENAYQIILNILSVLGMISEDYFKIIGSNKQKIALMKTVFISKTGKFHFSIPNIQNFLFIEKGITIGHDDNKPILSDNPSYLILPKAGTIKKGEEVFFLADAIS